MDQCQPNPFVSAEGKPGDGSDRSDQENDRDEDGYDPVG